MKRSSLLLIVLALAIVGASAWLVLRPQQSLPADPLAAIPGDAFGVVRIRVDRMLQSVAWQKLVVEQGEARGIERLRDTCGFNPLEGIEQLVVFARPAEDGGKPRFAFTARGDIKHTQLIDCVRKLSGKGGSQLTQEDVEGVTTVRSQRGTTSAAFVGRDGIIGGDAEGVRAVILAMQGKAPSLAKDPLLGRLYREGSETSDVQVVARVPREALPMLQPLARLGSEPLKALGSLRALSGSANFVGDKVTGGAVLVASTPAQAQELVQLASSLRARALGIPGIGLMGFSSTLRSIEMEARAERVTLGGGIKVSTAKALIELVPALSALRDGLDEPAAPAP